MFITVIIDNKPISACYYYSRIKVFSCGFIFFHRLVLLPSRNKSRPVIKPEICFKLKIYIYTYNTYEIIYFKSVNKDTISHAVL